MTQARDYLDEHDVDFLRLQFTDILGTVKSVSMPADRAAEVFDDGVWFDGSSIDGFARVHESDMRLEPDPDTLMVAPWRHTDRDGVTAARCICDVTREDGSSFPGDPRTILRQAVDRLAEHGYTMHVGPEPEFFVFESEDGPTTEPHDTGGYFDLAPRDLAESLRRDMIMRLSAAGFDIEASHHEVADGQHEIDFAHADAMTTADRIITFRTVVRAIAKQHGLHATFMPKPLSKVNGSGMHTHLSLFEHGENAFHDPDDPYGLSETGRRFMAGVMTHTSALTAVCNPTVNSYKRLEPGYEAPVYTAWSTANRSALIRVPSAADPAATRIELRSPDPSCNPYLALAAIIHAGLDGMERDLFPPDPVHDDIYELSETEREERGIDTLPDTLDAAVDALEADEVVRAALGDHAAGKFVAAKREEWRSFNRDVTAWERERYLEKF